MSGTPFDSNLPVPNGHMEVLYRQTYNTIGQATTADFTQSNVTMSTSASTGSNAISNGGRLSSTLGILAGSVVAVDPSGDNQIIACVGDSTTTYDKAVGIAINDAVGNPFESSSGISSERIVYCHGSGTVFKTDIYETYVPGGSVAIVYTPGDKLYASRNGLLTNSTGLAQAANVASAAGLAYMTVVGICLNAPNGSTDPYMWVQLKI